MSNNLQRNMRITKFTVKSDETTALLLHYNLVSGLSLGVVEWCFSTSSEGWRVLLDLFRKMEELQREPTIGHAPRYEPAIKV